MAKYSDINRMLRQAYISATMARICEILHISELQYSTSMYQAGLDYLDEYLKGDLYGKELLTHHATYWNWWKALYHNRDVDFLRENEELTDILRLKNLYLDKHDPKVLAAEIYPDGKMLGDTYAMMIGRVQDLKN